MALALPGLMVAKLQSLLLHLHEAAHSVCFSVSFFGAESPTEIIYIVYFSIGLAHSQYSIKTSLELLSSLVKHVH